MVIAGVGFLAPKDWRDRPPELGPSRRSYLIFEALSEVLLWAALGAHFVFCSWILDRIIVGESTPFQIPFLYAFVPLSVQLITSVWLAAILAGLISSAPGFFLSWLMTLFDIDIDAELGESGWNTRPVVVFGLMFLSFIGSFAYLFTRFSEYFFKYWIVEASVFFTFARGSINLLLYTGLFWLTKGFLALLAVWIPLLRRFNRLANSHGYLVVFACWNFVQALLYYRLRYDSKGTIKPPWTDNLG